MEKAGLILLYAGKSIPKGWLPCDGRLLKVRDNRLLYSIIGNKYGGNISDDTFGLPKRDNVNKLRYIICPDGEFIGSSLTYTFDPNDENRTIGFVLPFEGGNVPDGWVLCDGKQLINYQDETLYAAFGDTFNTTSTAANNFCLPKTDKPHIVCVSGDFPSPY